jgi:NIPSNAP protein
MKATHILSFAAGILLMLGVDTLNQSHAQSRHVFELRMYTANPGKLDAVQARFRDHTDAILKRHNMKPLGYWVPQDPPDSKNLFIYLVEHPSRQEADKNWAAFVEDPAWKKARADSEVNGTLVEDRNVHRYFMDPTSFSALK